MATVHPRVRGDMGSKAPQAEGEVGSPPRARGHVPQLGQVSSPDRFTPACAGTCDDMDELFFTLSVHPRVRGDMSLRPRSRGHEGGSPPRARGHGSTSCSVFAGFRFTPACAGTCCWLAVAWQQSTVHPRVRGDMTPDERVGLFPYGSPPRARGHASTSIATISKARFTPACAGTWRLAPDR